jgi:signal transduction histidine kinase
VKSLHGPTGSVARRVVAATFLCGILGFLAAPLVLRTAMREAIVRFHEPTAEYLYRVHEKARCEADPASWSMDLQSSARAFAYDGRTFASRNPAAPALDLGAVDKLREEHGPHVVLRARGLTLASGGALVFQGDDWDGPCAIIQTTWPEQSMGSALLAAFPLGALLAAVAAASVGFFVLVRPLERVESRRAELQRHLADVSHDLKTPISSLHLALEQALEESHEPALRPLLSSAMNDAVYLAALTANLRLASEMREGWSPAGQGATVDLTDVATRVVTRARFFAKQRGQTLEVAVPDDAARAGCDPLASEQALSNVIENAITHGEPGGHVAVVLETRGRSFTLTVADDGPGIRPSELPRLGERTFRSDAARQRDPRGSGLGLAITHEVCARCGWKLTFEAEEPHGLRVTIQGALQ